MPNSMHALSQQPEPQVFFGKSKGLNGRGTPAGPIDLSSHLTEKEHDRLHVCRLDLGAHGGTTVAIVMLASTDKVQVPVGRRPL